MRTNRKTGKLNQDMNPSKNYDQLSYSEFVMNLYWTENLEANS